jgi:predicted tellurium resistance membrane protein TerC
MDYLVSLALDPTVWAALAALIAMEVVLGIDNLIFISILTNKLPEAYQSRARRVGIGLALGLRLVLLGSIAVIVQLTEPFFAVFGHDFSWRDLILIGGGLFLVWKSTTEIHHTVDPQHGPEVFGNSAVALGFGAAIVQIILLDLVFSLDSIITAVGMTEHLPIMIVAVLVAVSTMLLAADPLARFIHNNPTVVMLALGFLLMIGMTLIAEGFGAHVPKGYIYAAMAFSAAIEGLNMLSRKARTETPAEHSPELRPAPRAPAREPAQVAPRGRASEAPQRPRRLEPLGTRSGS